jgi:hypothetical protein
VLGNLRDRGLLQMIGGRRGARYELGPAAVGALGGLAAAGWGRAEPRPILEYAEESPTGSGIDEVTVPSPGRLGSNLDDLESKPEGLAADPEGLAADPEGLEPSFEGSGPDSEGLRADLERISRASRESRYMSAIARDEILVDLCARAPLSVRELADLLGRHEAYIREALRPLIASGRLAFLYPDQPSHPRQKYVASQGSQASNRSPQPL